MNPNIFLIVIDTLRWDYSDPIWDVLKKWGFRSYDRVVASAPWTLPSHASMFTGLYPSLHGGHETLAGDVYPIRKSVRRRLITKILGDLGYKCYGFTANALITPAFGFNYFDHLREKIYSIDPLPIFSEDLKYLKMVKEDGIKKYIKLTFKYRKTRLASKIMLRYMLRKTHLHSLYSVITRKHVDKGAKHLIRDVEGRLKSNIKPLFVFINFMEVHEPYSIYELLKPGYSIKYLMEKGRGDPKIISYWRRGYRRQVLEITRRIRELMERIDEENYIDNSLIIITSDHGQLLGEYGGLINHIAFLYDELIRIPLFIKYPEEIEAKEIDDDTRWLSNIKIYDIILSVIKSMRHNKIFNISKIYMPKVYSESFGIHTMPIRRCRSEEECKFLRYNKRRVAVYYKQYKLVYDLDTARVEEYKDYNGLGISEERIEELIRYVKNHAKLIMLTGRIRIGK